MTTDRKRLDSITGRSIEQHIARARQLQAEALRDGLKRLFSRAYGLFENRRAKNHPALDGDEFVCGHI